MTSVLLTCEHGGNEIPVAYRSHFTKAKATLSTHRGLDIGALDLFHKMEAIAETSYHSTTSRLLVELNRSLYHPNLFSKWTKGLNQEEKNQIIADHYLPYRYAVESYIRDSLKKKDQLMHISVHSFTPELDGIVRNADIGLLYDPQRASEKRFATAWAKAIRDHAPDLRVRMNYPYRRTADGFTTYLRRKFKKNYSGIELEVNQKWAAGSAMDKRITEVLIESVRTVLE